MFSKIVANVRGYVAQTFAEGTDEQMQLNTRGELLIAQALPPLAELVRMGKSYQSMSTAAVAALIVRPSTAALFSLWNGEPMAGKTYVIDSVFVWEAVQAAAGSFGIWVMNNVVQGSGIAKPAGAALAVKSQSGRGASDNAVAAVGGAVTDDGWFPEGDSVLASAGAATIGYQKDVDLRGKYIVKPGGMFNVHVVAAAVGQTFTVGVRWHELQLPIV